MCSVFVQEKVYSFNIIIKKSQMIQIFLDFIRQDIIAMGGGYQFCQFVKGIIVFYFYFYSFHITFFPQKILFSPPFKSKYFLFPNKKSIPLISRFYFPKLYKCNYINLAKIIPIKTMQNTVIERNSLNLTSNTYMNSTTKFVKGININPQTVQSNKNSKIISSLKSSKSVHHQQKGEAQSCFSNFVRSTLGGHGKEEREIWKSSSKQRQDDEHILDVESTAMKLSANVFMNSTTKFVKGFFDLLPLNVQQNQKKQIQTKQISHKKQQINSHSSLPIHNNIEKIGLEMAAVNYMTSTTKYLKQGGNLENSKGFVGGIQKIIKTQRPMPKKKTEDVPLRNRMIKENEGEKSRSKSDSQGKISRKRKERKKELKFIKPKQSNENNQLLRKDQVHQINEEKKSPDSLRNLPLQRKLSNRNNIKDVRSSDAKKNQIKQEVTSLRPFTRQPQNTRQQLLGTQRIQQQNTSILNIPHENNSKPIQRVKSQTVVGSGQLLVDTPVKINQIIQEKQIKKQVPFSTIKQERSSMVQDTKTSINNNNKITVQSTIQQQVHNSEIGKGKQFFDGKKYVNVAKQENIVVQTKQKFNQLAKVSSAPTIKLQETINTIYKKPIVRKNNQQIQINKAKSKEEIVFSTQNLKDQQKSEEQQSNKIKTQTISIKKSTNAVQNPVQKDAKTPYQFNFINEFSLKNNPISKRYAHKVEQVTITQKVVASKQEEPIITQKGNKQNFDQKNKKIDTLIRKRQEKIQIKQRNYLQKAKESKIIVLITQRLFLRTLRESFNKIAYLSITKTKHERQKSILCYEIINIHNYFYIMQVRNAFDAFKRLLLFKNINERPSKSIDIKQVGANLIFRSIISRYRQHFEDIKWASKQYEPQISMQTHQRVQQIQKKQQSSNVLLQLSKIIHNFLLYKIRKSFQRIQIFACTQRNIIIQNKIVPQGQNARKYEKPSRNYQTERLNLSKQKADLQSSISLIQQQISQKKYSYDLQKSKLIKRQTDLTQKNKKAELFANQKHKKNKQISLKIEQFGTPSDLDIALPQSQPLVSLLTQIYSYILNEMTPNKLNVQQIRQKYNLNKQQQNILLKQWQIININIKLKGEIGCWQRQGVSVSYRNLLNEKQLSSKILQSYIRQRYLWQFVKINTLKL